jgi:cbb3-type cytochrome oxidase maturation protein
VSVVFIVVPLAALIVLAAVIAFVASARRGQFDDLDTPAVRMLHDDSEQQTPTSRARASHNDFPPVLR